VNWTKVPEMVSRFAGIVEAEIVGDAARAAVKLISDLGAVEAHLELKTTAPDSICLSWTWDSGLQESSPELPAPLAGLRQTARDQRVASAVVPNDDGMMHWACLSIPSPEGPVGTIAFALEADAPDCVLAFALLASTLGVKAAQLQAESEFRRESERSAGWFKTMDEQIRVLEGERQKFSTLVNKTDAAIFVTEPDGQIIWVNAVMARRYGLDRSNLVGRNCSIICGDDDSCENCPVRMVREGKPMLHQERDEIQDNETRHLYVSAFPVRSPEGHVNQVLVMLQDLTDLETLRKSEARYQLLFERSADAIVMAECNSLEILMANRQARELLGLDPESEPRRTLPELHPETVREDMENRYRRLGEGHPLDNVEVGVLAENGDLLTCNACGTLFDLDNADGILVEFRDVTKLRELQSELARSDHLITLGTMNAGIAHEFKNRLAPIRAFAQLITLQRTHLDKLLAHAPLMIEEIDRLSSLVRDILDYARPQDSSRVPENFVGIIQDHADEFLDEYRSVIESLDIACEFVFPTDDAYLVNVDASQIRRAFLNLFKNSLEAIAEIDGEKRLRLEITERDGLAVLSMSDTGCGIEEENISRIFDPFFSTKGPKGTGLGMCITKSLIEVNEGTIEVTSRRGEGTRVELSFPVVSEINPAVRVAAERPGDSGIGRKKDAA
jgi:PAS domain S-box-containing protein